MTLPQKTLLGALLGIIAGVLFGDYCSYLRPIGAIYVLLLQVAVFPYLISSLLRSLGNLVPHVAFNLLKRGWWLYVFFLALTFVVMILLSFAIPSSQSSINIDSAASAFNISALLNLLIPSNPFAALSQNYVPAIIIFCVLYGVMIQHVKKKQAFFEVLDTISAASLEFWNRLVIIVPYAVFALFADTAGTINYAELRELSVYLLIFFIGTLSLAFWIIPAIVSSLTSIKQKEFLSELREGLLLAISTTLSVVALPAIQEFTRKLLAHHEAKETDEIIRTVSSVAYAFAQLGNCFLYLFVIFAAFYLGHPLQASQQILLPLMSYLSSIGSPSATVSSVNFLSEWLKLPDSATALYVNTLTLTRYGQVIASVMGIAALTILMTLAYYRKLKIQVYKLSFNLLLMVVILGLFAFSAHFVKPLISNNIGKTYDTFQLDTKLISGVDVAFVNKANAATMEDALVRIQRTHVIRVGYNSSVMPFCYLNNQKQLVGYDVAMMYALAQSLHSKIEFIPFSWESLVSDLKQNKFDIAIGGIYASEDRLSQAGLTAPYFYSQLALIVPENQKNNYKSIGNKSFNKSLKVGIFDDPILRQLAQRYFSDAKIIVLPSYEDLAAQESQHNIDVALWTQEQAQAWVMLHPGYAAIIPQRLAYEPSLAFAYLVQSNSTKFLYFLNYWLALKKEDGFEQQQYQKWVLGKSSLISQKRWNIIDMIFHH